MIQEVPKVIKDLTGFPLSQTIPNYCLPNFDMNGNILSMCIQAQFCITYIVPNITHVQDLSWKVHSHMH